GVLPTVEQIGIAAPMLLVVLRMAQGIGLGGEWGGAALVVVENAPARRRGLYGCAMQIGVPAGQLLSAGMLAIFSALPDEQFFSWGWRVPFLFSAALIFVGMYIRVRLTETPRFQEVKETATHARLPII